jgi:branched-chain amino acid transport system substrate-binding protein
MLAMLAGCGNGAGSSSKVIKIGVVMPLIGSVASFGQSGEKGLKLLEKQTNDAGGILGKKVQFIFEDDQAVASTSVTVGQKLITNDKVVAIIGPLTSTCANSLAPIAQQDKIPMVTGTATNVKVTQAGNYIFRTCFIDPFQGTVVAKFAYGQLKAKTAAVLYNNGDDYSNGLAQSFITSFKAAGGKIVATETYNTGDKDFSAQLTKIAPYKPDVMMLPDYYSTVAVIAKEARGIGIQSTFLGGDGWDSSELFSIGGSAVNGAYFSNHYSPDDTAPQVQQFIKDFKAEYGNATPDAMAALNYDAGKVLIQSIKNAGKTDGDSIRKTLQAYNGTVVSGHITIDSNRNAVKSAVIIKTVNGKETFFARVNP